MIEMKKKQSSPFPRQEQDPSKLKHGGREKAFGFTLLYSDPDPDPDPDLIARKFRSYGPNKNRGSI